MAPIEKVQWPTLTVCPTKPSAGLQICHLQLGVHQAHWQKKKPATAVDAARASQPHLLQNLLADCCMIETNGSRMSVLAHYPTYSEGSLSVLPVRVYMPESVKAPRREKKPATAVDAAWAAQPHLLGTGMGDIRRPLVPIEGGVPHALDQRIVRVRQRLPLLRE